MKNKKRGQVTLFVILAIVILIIAGGTIWFISRERRDASVNSKQPDELPQVKVFVESCLYNTGKDAILLAGAHGGYVYPEKYSIRTRGPAPTEANGISIFEDSEVIPYWFYLKSPNTCQSECEIASEKPNLYAWSADTSVENQLADYVNDNIRKCLQNFTPLADQGIELVSAGSPSARFFIKAENIEASLKYPVTVSYEGKQYSTDEYSYVFQVSFERAFQLASKIIALSEDSSIAFFERKTVHMIGTYGLGKDPVIAPISGGYDVGTTKTSWQLQSIDTFLRDILQDHASVYNVENTRNSRILLTEDASFNGIYNDFAISVEDLQNPQDYSVNLIYLSDWPIYVNVGPSKGNTIAAENSKVLGLVPITHKDFYYDVSYPMVLSIQDHTAFNGEGFTLLTAFEVNVRNNQPLNVSASALQASNTNSLFCDLNQKRSGDVTISVRDSAGAPLESVSITYECGDQACFIGDTDTSGTITDKLPLCLNGRIVANDADHFIRGAELGTLDGKPENIQLKADNFVPLQVSLQKLRLVRMLTSTQLWETSDTMTLSADDKAIVIFERQSDELEPDIIESVEVSGKDLLTKDVNLVPGTYYVTIELLTNLGNDSISNKTITIEEDGQKWVLDSAYISGSLDLGSNNTQPVVLTAAELTTGKINIIVPYAGPEQIHSAEDLVSFQAYADYLAQTLPEAFRPRFG